MLTGKFTLDNLVCETYQPDLAPGFHWYEADYDAHGGDMTWARRQPDVLRLIFATRHSVPSYVEAVIQQAAICHATHIQFEAGDGHSARRIVAQAHGSGIDAIPARHLREPLGAPHQLRGVVNELAETGASAVKVVFPARDWTHVMWAVDLLGDWPLPEVRLSITPSGNRQARVAAALAGSRLVYAPLDSTSERMSAFWYRDFIRVETSAPDTGMDTW